MNPTKCITRKQKFKELMIHRGTIEKGLTFRQIFFEVYHDVIEEDIDKRYDSTGGLVLDDPYYIFNEHEWEVKYLKQLMIEAKRKDDEFRWFSASKPIKTNRVNKVTGKKVRPYAEYRYVNVKASETPELLSEINAYWLKRNEAILRGLDKSDERLRAIIDATSTPEGKRQSEIAYDAFIFELESRLFVNDGTIDKMVKELRQEGRLPSGQYKLDYGYLTKVIRKEVMNDQSLTNIFSALPSSSKNERIKEVYKLMKDTIEAYSDKEHLKTEAEANTKRNAMKYDWEALEYR